MNLQQAQEQLEALPGVYDVSVMLQEGHWAFDSLFDGAEPDFVAWCVRVASPELLPEETRQGILRIRETLESELSCVVSVAVSAGLRMPRAS